MKFPALDCPRCGLPNPEGRDPVRHQEVNCAFCRAGGAMARGNSAPTWKPGDPVRSDYAQTWVEAKG